MGFSRRQWIMAARIIIDLMKGLVLRSILRRTLLAALPAAVSLAACGQSSNVPSVASVVDRRATLPPAFFNVTANDHVQGMLLHGNDQVAVQTDLSGSITGLDLDTSLAFAPDGSFWVGNIGVLGHPPSLEHFGKGAVGNTAPLATITCGLSEVTGVAVDKTGNVYALNRQSETIAEFAPTQHGCAKPVAVIGGSKTGLSQGMLALALDAQGRIYAGSFMKHTVVVFAPGSNGNVAPIGILQKGMSSPSAIAFDPHGNLVVGSIDIGTISTYAAGKFGPNVAPIREIDGSLTSRPQAMAVTRDGRIFTLNFEAGVKFLFEYPANANGNVSPDATWDSDTNPALAPVESLTNPFAH